MNHLLLFFAVINNIAFLNCNNIVLPFRKLTIGNFNGLKSVDDFITYNIYGNISVGTPPQTVAHFIDPTQNSFNYQRRLVTYGNNKFKPFIPQYDNLTNFWFDELKSSTFKKNDTTNFCWDVYYFNNLKNEEKKANIKYGILDTHINDAYKCGNIGLNNPTQSNQKQDRKESYFFEELKENGLITDSTFSITYEERNDLFDFNQESNYGTIVFGESPHLYNPEKYKKEDLVNNDSNDWCIRINTVKINSTEGEIIQENIEIQINLISGFFKGTESYRLKVEEIFFSELFKTNLCQIDTFTDNIYLANYNVFSCENSFSMRNRIKSFPNLYFELANGLEFMFTYEELFKVFNDRLYFMVIFREKRYTVFAPRWAVGELFLRKYLTVFNYETKEISFYKNQVEEINIESENSAKSSLVSKVIKIVGAFLIGLILIWIIFVLYRKYLKSKKVNASDLEDNNSSDDKNKMDSLLEKKN